MEAAYVLHRYKRNAGHKGRSLLLVIEEKQIQL